MDENSRWHFDYDDDCLEENKHGDDDDFLEKTIKKSFLFMFSIIPSSLMILIVTLL